MNRSGREFFTFGPFRLHPGERTLTRDQQPIGLTPKEFDTLLALVEAEGTALSKDELIERVWPDSFVGDGSLARNISVLRKALGEQVIETLPRRGYRVSVPVHVVTPEIDASSKQEQQATAPGPAESTADPEPATARVHNSRLRWAVLAGLAIMAVVVGVPLYRSASFHGKVQASQVPVRIAVLPFANYTGNAQNDYLCDGMSEALIAELSLLNPRQLAVIARTSAMHYKNTDKAIPRIAEELKADYILESSLRIADNRVRITAQLVRGSDASHVWTGEYDRDVRNIVDVQQVVAGAIANEVRLTVDTVPEERPHNARAVNADAYHQYLLGRFNWNKRNREGLLKSVEHFNRAIEIDPNYAAAYAGLADAYLVLGGGYLPDIESYDKARAAAEKAIELDSGLSEAYTALAYEKFVNERDWLGAESNYRRALILDPNNANAHHWYALYLAAMQRSDDAVREIQRAVDLDPLALGILYNAGWVHMLARRYDEAQKFAERALEVDPSSAPAHGTLAVNYRDRGMYQQAAREFDTAQKLRNEYSPYAVEMAHVYALAGETERARNMLRPLLSDPGWAKVAPYSFAVTYAALGDKGKAFEWLRRSIDDHSCTVMEINTDHGLDSLRADARFAEIKKDFHLSE